MAGLSVRTNLINRRRERHARGQCLNCDNPHRPNKTLCQTCADKNSAATKKKKKQVIKEARREVYIKELDSLVTNYMGVFTALETELFEKILENAVQGGEKMVEKTFINSFPPPRKKPKVKISEL